MELQDIHVSAFLSFNIAIILLICGKIITMNVAFLRQYSIPEAAAGGFLCAAFVGLLYYTLGYKISFELGVRDFLLLVFFAGIGIKSDVRALLLGGRPLAILVCLAAVFIFIQNLTGMGIASLFGFERHAGLMVGSVSLVGGVGTTLAWAPTFSEMFGVTNALELGIAANTVGLIAACIIGGPTAAFLMKRYNVEPSGNLKLEIGAAFDIPRPKMDYFCLLWAMLIINGVIILGLGLHALIEKTGLTLPTFVSCLLAGILVRTFLPYLGGKTIVRLWPGVSDGQALISDLSLGLFMVMALMGLQLWELQNVFLFITVVLTLQIVLTILYTIFVIFPAMGRNYEAVVMSAGFGGITLGSTTTAIANMTAVTQQYGAAHKAFLVVPLVCGFFIDIINALAISVLLQ